MDYDLTAGADADDAHFSLENERNSLRAISRRPKELASREAPFDGLLEKRAPCGRRESVEQGILGFGLSQKTAL